MQQSPLRRALFDRGEKQVVLARKAGIERSRLSLIMCGHLQANEREQQALARVLRVPVTELFPE